MITIGSVRMRSTPCRLQRQDFPQYPRLDTQIEVIRLGWLSAHDNSFEQLLGENGIVIKFGPGITIQVQYECHVAMLTSAIHGPDVYALFDLK